MSLILSAILAEASVILAFLPFSIDARASIESGDRAYRDRGVEAQARSALAEYRAAYASHPEDPESGWRVGMACYFIGLRLTHDSSEKLKLFAEGRDAALSSAKRAPLCAPCHFWAAINMALYGEEVGAFKMLFSLGGIEEHLKKSIEIDPTYASGGAYRLLGVIHEKLPGILGGSDEKAREFYQKAVHEAPDEPLNYLFLAQLLDVHLNDPKGALAAARKGTEIGSIPPERLESLEAKSELAIWLQKHSPRE